MTTDYKRVKHAQRNTEANALANVKTREQRLAMDTKRWISKFEDGTPAYEGGYSWRDAGRFSTLAAALAAFGSSSIGAEVSRPITLTANATIPSTTALSIRKGGRIDLNGFTLTINGAFSAGSYQVFSGAGSVIFGDSSVKFVVPQWWGALGDGSTDDYAAIAAALAAFRVVVLPPAVYMTTARILLPSYTKIFGHGATIKLASSVVLDHTNAFRIVYASAATEVEVHGLTIDGNKEAFTLDVSGIQVYAFGFRADNSTRCRFVGITIQEIPGIAFALYGSNDNSIESFVFRNFGAKRGSNRYENGDGIYLGNSASRNAFVRGQIYHEFVTGQTESGPTRCGITISSGAYNRFAKLKINNTNRAIQMETDDVSGSLTHNDFEGVDINENTTDGSYYCIIFESKAGYNTEIHDNTFRSINCRGGIGNIGSPSSAVDIALKSYGPLVYNNTFEDIYAGGVFVAGSGFVIRNTSMDYLRTEAIGNALELVSASFTAVEFRGVVSTSTLRFSEYVRFMRCYSKSSGFQINHDSAAANAIFEAVGCRWAGSVTNTYLLQVGCASGLSENYFYPVHVSGTTYALRLFGNFEHKLINNKFRPSGNVNYGVYVDTGRAQFVHSYFASAFASSNASAFSGGVVSDIRDNGSGGLRLTGTVSLGSTLGVDGVATFGAAVAMNSTLTVGTNAGGINSNLNGAAGNERAMVVQTAGVARWKFGGNGTAEGGSDSGTKYVITACDDAGAAIDSPVVINRAAGGTIIIGRKIEFDSAQESTGAGTPLFGTNCPASTLTAPYRWIKFQTSDGSQVYIPAWK